MGRSNCSALKVKATYSALTLILIYHSAWLQIVLPRLFAEFLPGRLRFNSRTVDVVIVEN
jgi:hypothetical protein